MSDLDHKVGVKEANLVKRTLALTGRYKHLCCRQIGMYRLYVGICFQQQVYHRIVDGVAIMFNLHICE